MNDKPVVTGQSLSVNEDETVSIILQEVMKIKMT